MLVTQAINTVATSQRSRTLDCCATACACFCLREIAGTSWVEMAWRDIVTDGMASALLTFPGKIGTGIVGSSTEASAPARNAATEEDFFPFRCSPCTVFCQ